MILVSTQESFVYILDSGGCLAKPTTPPYPLPLPSLPPSLPLMHSVEGWAWDRKVDITLGTLGIFVRRVLTTIDCGKYLSLVFSSYPVIFRAILMLCFCGIQSRYYRR